MVRSSRTFRTKTQLTKELRALIQGKPPQIITDESDLAVLRDLFKFHYDQESKFHKSVKHVHIGRDKYKHNCLYLEYDDGTKDDISYVV